MSTHYLTQPRIEPGVRTGGQWTQHQHGVSGVSLGPAGSAAADDPAPGRTGEVLRARRQRLAAVQTGYIEPAAVRTGADPRQAGDPGSWWDTHFVTAEYGAADGDYAQMPDDFTPRRTTGRSIVGMRRTHRMAYKSADGSFAVRMPSATSIKAFERQSGTTFDVPVSAVATDGRVVSGWVRVTRSGSNWAATELGDFGPSGVEVSEAVSCVLEARRPSRALAQAGDLRRRRAEKVARNGVTVVPVPSTFIDTIAYDSSSGIMGVTIRGKTYGYQVPETSFESVRVDRTPGRAYNRLVKGRPRMAVERCGQCGRFTSEAATHTCPLGHHDRTGARYAHNDVARRAAARYARAPHPPADPAAPPDAPAPAANAAPGEAGQVLAAGGHSPIADQVASTLAPDRIGDRTVTLRSGIHEGRRVVAVVLTDGDGRVADGAEGTPAVQLFSVDRTPSGSLLGPLVTSKHAHPAPVNGPAQPHGPDPAGIQRIDLAAMLRQPRPGARSVATTRDGATSGWTRHPEVTDSLAPYTSSRYVPHLYGNQVANGHYGVVGFDGMSGPAAARLLEAMPGPVRATRHRSAPTTGDLLRAAATHPGRVEVGGYTTHPDMFGGDRMRAESVQVYDVRGDEAPDQAWARVSREYQLQGGDPAQAQIVTVPWTGRQAWRFAWA